MSKSLNEAIGVNCYNIDQKTGQELTHSEVYGRAIALLGGAETVVKVIPLSLETLRKQFARDRYLNTIPLQRWDNWGYDIGERLKVRGVHATPCELVCILKEAVKQLAERGKQA